MWKTKEDVLSTLDEVSVFTKNQESVRRLKIKSSKNEHRKKLKDSKRKEECAEKKEYMERIGIYTGDSDSISEYSSSEGNNINRMSLAKGRAQQISHYKKQNESQSRERYIHRQVQMAAGCYSNDLIEHNWRASVKLNRNLDPDTKGNTSEDSDSQFDDAEGAEESNSVISNFVSKSNESSCKKSPTKELSSAEQSGETCYTPARTSPISVLDKAKPAAPIQPSTEIRPPLKTKPPRQRNALLLSLQKKIAANEKSLESVKEDSTCKYRAGNEKSQDTDKEDSTSKNRAENEKSQDTDKEDSTCKNSAATEAGKEDSICENSIVLETDKKEYTCEDSAILEYAKKDSTSGTKALGSGGCKNGKLDFRLLSPSKIVEFKPRSVALVCTHSTNMAYNCGTVVESNPDVEHYCDLEVGNNLDANREHNPNMGVECYPNMDVQHYPTTGVEQYCNMGTEHYPNIGVKHYPEMVTSNRPNPSYRNYGTVYYTNPSEVYYPSANHMFYPGTVEERNPVHFTGNSRWYPPVYSESAFKSDPLFAPSTEKKMVTEYKYKEEEFPPL